MRVSDYSGLLDKYVNGDITADELSRLKEFAALSDGNKKLFEQDVATISLLKAMGAANNIKNKVARAEAASLPTLVHDHDGATPVLSLWEQYKYIASIAACFLVICGLAIYSSRQHEITYEALRRDVARVAATQNSLIKKMRAPGPTGRKANFNGTGFAVTGNGYILTNYHVIKGADSVLVQSWRGNNFKAKPVYTDAVADLAILKVTDSAFKGFASLPYTLANVAPAIGERVYTIGYPKDDLVLGEGYISSNTGYNSDSLQYQLALAANPGNSGAPVFDNNGRVLGIISGKDARIEGATFAIKPQYIQDALNAIPSDSLAKRVLYNRPAGLGALTRTAQVKNLQQYLFLIKVY